MKLVSSVLFLSALVPPLPAQTPSVPRFAPHEVTLTATGRYANPYTGLAAEAVITEPDDRTTRTLPLFWDGGDNWRLRFAPDKIGTWKWAVRSADRGLDGRAGTFECVASNRRGSIEPMNGVPHHFQYQNGGRIWFMGDTQWSLVTDNADERHDRASVERYLRNRAAQGFNVVHLMLLNEAGWDNAGGPPWADLATEKLNPGYWREVDARIAFANAQGLVCGLALAWGDKGRNEKVPWGRFPGAAARARYARYIAARYGAFDVYFLVSGEWHGEARTRKLPEQEVRGEFVAIGDALQAANAHRRMIGIHPMGSDGSTREFHAAATWMSFGDYQQNYHKLHARALESRRFAKPVVNSEYAYFLRDQNGDGIVDKPHSYTLESIRHATWDLVMAGAYVVTGFGSTYMGGHRHPTPFLPDDPKNAPWAAQLGRVKEFFTALDYWTLEPHDEMLACAAPRGEDRSPRDRPDQVTGKMLLAPATTYWCLAAPGRTYVVYVRGTTEPVALALPAAAGGWRAERFDPRTGARAPLPAPIGGGSFEFRAPDAQDWLAVVTHKAASPRGTK